MSEELYDLAIVGYGPTGMTLAALAGRRGWRVAVLERYAGLYNLPRAACFDDEIMRTFQKLGLVEEVLEGAVVQPDYEWVNAAGETLVELSYDDPATGGWAALYMMFQPHVETVLDRCCKSLDSVEVRQGVTVSSVTQDGETVAVAGVGADGAPVHVRARWLVGADGGTSFVRRTVGAEPASYGFEENWLVCDFRKRREIPHVPTFRQVCDPAQPIAIVRIGPDHQRFSFMLDRDEAPERATEPARVWQRVSDYLTPDDAELIRVANYVFRSRIVDRWRHGRILLAGDAAHEMPPFLAQGMCSGIRDSHNLAWKLDLVLRGEAGPELLDTYQPEREPHVRFITEKAIELGRVQTLRDPDAARLRDERLLARRRADQAPEKLRFPPLAGGLLGSGDGAGEVFPQGRVRRGAATGRFDDVAGPAPYIVVRSADVLAGADADELAYWRRLGGTAVALGPGHDAATSRVADVDGTYADWFDAHACDAVVVRPDWYVYGTATGAERLDALVGSLRTTLAASSGRDAVA